MTFRIIEITCNGIRKFELWYRNDYDRQGIKWERVIWDYSTEDNNYVDSKEEARAKAREFKENYESEHGECVLEFTIL